jgi:hypothetical protein
MKGRPKAALRLDLFQDLVGGRGHYLNSRIELGSGVLDLMRAHRDRLDHASADC